LNNDQSPVSGIDRLNCRPAPRPAWGPSHRAMLTSTTWQVVMRRKGHCGVMASCSSSALHVEEQRTNSVAACALATVAQAGDDRHVYSAHQEIQDMCADTRGDRTKLRLTRGYVYLRPGWRENRLARPIWRLRSVACRVRARPPADPTPMWLELTITKLNPGSTAVAVTTPERACVPRGLYFTRKGVGRAAGMNCEEQC
jgi:hypothetical protein